MAGPGTATPQNADLSACGDITDPVQYWQALIYPGYVMLRQVNTDFCLDGREGTATSRYRHATPMACTSGGRPIDPGQ
jgi:hypothetical protein